MPKLTLFHAPNSRSFRALWALEEAGFPYEMELVDFQAPRSAELLELNPMGKVPVLVADGVSIADSTAILLYLGDLAAAGTLAPPVGDSTRGRYLELMTYTLAVLEPSLFVRANKWDYDPSAAGWGRWDTTEARLQALCAEGPYALGEAFSAADILIGSTLQFMISFGALDESEPYTSYLGRLAARPAFGRAQAKDAG